MPNTFYLRWESSTKYRYLFLWIVVKDYQKFPVIKSCTADHAEVRSICFVFYLQDDYLDSFGDPTVTGKIGTDIQDNKCSWMVVKALEVMTPEQKSVLEVRLKKKQQQQKTFLSGLTLENKTCLFSKKHSLINPKIAATYKLFIYTYLAAVHKQKTFP